MEFFAVNGRRPVRLSEETRRFAHESLNHKYGKDTMAALSVPMDGVLDFEAMSELEKYDAAIEQIVKNAPVRICEGERLSGAATLGMAINHNVPATFRGESAIGSSVSHLTVNFDTVLKKGVDHLCAAAEESLKKHIGTDREPFLRSCLHCFDCMRLWHGRYLSELSGRDGYEENYNNLKKVPFGPAESFREALQSLWFTFAFIRLCGNWPGIGRIDLLLGQYLKNDLERGILTLDEARELLAHFFIKGCEWVRGGNCGSGDAQHYQNIILSGIDENGNDVTNEVTYLVLDIIEELGISDFPTSVRVSKNTDGKLLRRVAEVIRLGGGVVAVYNEDLVIKSLTDYGYGLAEARSFANDGCWEVQVPGKTFFNYIPFDGLRILQQNTLDGYSGRKVYNDYEALYRGFINDLQNEVNRIISCRNESDFILSGVSTKDWKWAPNMSCTVVSVFEDGCIEKGLSYLEGGPIYNVVSPHIGGLIDVVNSLYAIKKLVFDDKILSLEALIEHLRTDWEDSEPLRRFALNKYSYFGNDNDEADGIARDIINDFADICDRAGEGSGYMTPAGVSTFGRQLEWSGLRLATSYGKKAHEVLSGNFSPTPGTDREGATAIIRSYCKADLKRTVSGAALDIKLLPSAVNGENGAEAIASLIRGFVLLGGHFMQLDIADTELLKRAQEDPSEYLSLSVRVSGWNARFVTLNKQWQDMIIARNG